MILDKNQVYVKYYATFIGYNHPVKLVDEIELENLDDRTSYYIGYYENNLLIKVEKKLNKEIAFTYIYTYNTNRELIKVILKRDDKENNISF